MRLDSQRSNAIAFKKTEIVFVLYIEWSEYILNYRFNSC